MATPKTPTTRINELAKKLEQVQDATFVEVTPIAEVAFTHTTKKLPASTQKAIRNIEPNVFDIVTTREPEEDGTYYTTVSIYLTDPIDTGEPVGAMAIPDEETPEADEAEPETE